MVTIIKFGFLFFLANLTNSYRANLNELLKESFSMNSKMLKHLNINLLNDEYSFEHPSEEECSF